MGLKQTSHSSDGDLQVSQEAAVWLQRLREQDTPEVRAEFAAWIRQGATNLQEFLFAQAVWQELDHMDDDMRRRLWSNENAQEIVAFPARERARPGALRLSASPRRYRLLSAAAIVIAVAIGWAMVSLVTPRSNVYATERGEQRSIKLSDGSVVDLNTSSRLKASFTKTQRVVRLSAGEALFKVAHDPQRPFYVVTDSAQIRAVGTEFNVYRSSGMRTRVAVIEGVVQVSAIRHADSSPTPQAAESNTLQLRAGDEVSVEPAAIVKAPVPNVERAVAWRERRLMFPGDPIGEIAAEFNRYNEIPIRIEGERLQAHQMSGVFDAHDPSPLLQHLERDPAIEIVRSPHEILIRSREEPRSTPY
jgi:transmembrane sensor